MSEKFDEQLKHTIEQIGPDEKQTDEIWRGVQERAQHKTKKFPAFRVAAAGMCVLALCVVTGAGVNAATDGAFSIPCVRLSACRSSRRRLLMKAL